MEQFLEVATTVAGGAAGGKQQQQTAAELMVSQLMAQLVNGTGGGEVLGQLSGAQQQRTDGAQVGMRVMIRGMA